MMLEKIIKYVSDNKFKRKKFVYYGLRNQNEEFYGEITEIYSKIFVITLLNNSRKTFTYSDLLIGNLKIYNL